MSEFLVEKTRLEKLAWDMCQEMENGLSHKQSSLLMLPTYVHRLPDGSEYGKFLALDFGGSTFRVILVELRPNHNPVIKSVTVPMENRMKFVSGEELFDYLATCVADFIKEEGLAGGDFSLGFTFSYPMNQASLSYGTLVQWTKGFANAGVVGQDVVQLLNKALSRNETTKNVQVVALTNDTAGTLVAGCITYKNCQSGLIVGSGCNAAYTEKVANVSMLTGCSEEMVVINMEWGNFGELGHLNDIQTEYDKKLDISSNNEGKQLFEKMIGGIYTGELVRLALLDRVTSAAVFSGNAPAILCEENSLDGAVVSNCISDEGAVRALFPEASPADVALVREVCGCVSDRAARLAAAGIHAIWLKRGKEEFTVAVDGSVFLKHATFARVMRSTLEELCCTATLQVATDGSGLGSALIAAIA